MKKKNKDKWHLVVFERITHLIVGLVSIAGLGLSMAGAFEMEKWLESMHVSDFDMFVFHVIAGAYLLFDAFVILRYIGRKIYQASEEDDEDD